MRLRGRSDRGDASIRRETMTREALDEEIELPLGELDSADETFCFRMSVYVNDLTGDLANNDPCEETPARRQRRSGASLSRAGTP